MNEFETRVKDLYDGSAKIREIVPNLQEAFAAMKEFESLVGVESYKEAVKTSIKSYLVDVAINDSKLVRGKQHVILSGSPGTGKTFFAKAMAKVLVKFGYINTTDNDTLSNNLDLSLLLDPNLLILIVMAGWTLVSNFSWRKLIGFTFLILMCIFLPVIMRFIKSLFSSKDTEFFIAPKREDLVDRFVGGTAGRTKEYLSQCVGKIVFIDEAYKLINGTDFDYYGKEAINTLMEFMDQQEGRVLFIFGGYKEQMDNSIFNVQPGLKRRFNNVFHLEGYNGKQLHQIFLQQLSKYNLQVEGSCEDIFVDNAKDFPFFGGDTGRLADYVNKFYKERVFDDLSYHGKPVSRELIERGLEHLREMNKTNSKQPAPKSELVSALEEIMKKT